MTTPIATQISRCFGTICAAYICNCRKSVCAYQVKIGCASFMRCTASCG